jgi:hypothetical protein
MEETEKKGSAALYCYSRAEFEALTEQLKWYPQPDQYVAVISISDSSDRRHLYPTGTPRVLNVDFDDIDAEQWWNKVKHDDDRYDDLMQMYVIERKQKMNHHASTGPFWNTTTDEHGEKRLIHAMDFYQADIIEKFIADAVKKNLNIYIHCEAGTSRSQGVASYIIGAYPEVTWRQRESNPCRTPNAHVSRMLNRAHIFNTEDNSSTVDIEYENTVVDEVWEPEPEIIPEVRQDTSTNQSEIVYVLKAKGKELELTEKDVMSLIMEGSRVLTISKEEITMNVPRKMRGL